MRLRQFFLLFLLISFFALLTVPISAQKEPLQITDFAQEEKSDSEKTKIVEVKRGEVINHDFFAAGESVTISGVVNGDVYAAGANVVVDGRINGDLLAGAGIINILGEVSDDVRIGGGNVLINGTIGKNLTVGGGSVIITREADIGGSILVFGGSLDVRGPIGRDANVYAGQAIFANQVSGDLKGAVEKLTLTDDDRILGDLEYESKKEANIAEGALISGQTTHKLPKEGGFGLGTTPAEVSKPLMAVLQGISLYMKFFSFL